MAEIEVEGEKFRVEVEGPAGAPVLMISNSLGTNLHMWDLQMPALTQHFRVVRYDSRGHGGSPAPARAYSIDELGRDALNIMDALGLDKVRWLGLSKGGMVGQWLLTHAPERIERAVLANTAANMGPPDVWNDRIRLVREQGMAGVTEAVLDRWFTKPFQKSDPQAVQKIRDMLLATLPQGYLGCIAAIRDMDQREAIRAVEAPVLVIVGRHDASTPPAAGALIAANVPGAELVTLEAAHLSNIEDEKAFTSTVVDFLTRPRRTR
jgi:3-oxoadipate enol-lactonase